MPTLVAAHQSDERFHGIESAIGFADAAVLYHRRRVRKSYAQKPSGPRRRARFPAHWGHPPEAQNFDRRILPDGYGQGSSTVSAWIGAHLRWDSAVAADGGAGSSSRVIVRELTCTPNRNGGSCTRVAPSGAPVEAGGLCVRCYYGDHVEVRVADIEQAEEGAVKCIRVNTYWVTRRRTVLVDPCLSGKWARQACADGYNNLWRGAAEDQLGGGLQEMLEEAPKSGAMAWAGPGDDGHFVDPPAQVRRFYGDKPVGGEKR